MQTVLLILTTAVLFLAIDAVMLNAVLAPMFRDALGPLMLDTPRWGGAAAFYVFYVIGLVILVSRPALAANQPRRALWQGALLGAIAYGTYEWTSYAILAAWTLPMVLIDWGWGAVLTGTSAALGVVVTRRLTQSRSMADKG